MWPVDLFRKRNEDVEEVEEVVEETRVRTIRVVPLHLLFLFLGVVIAVLTIQVFFHVLTWLGGLMFCLPTVVFYTIVGLYSIKLHKERHTPLRTILISALIFTMGLCFVSVLLILAVFLCQPNFVFLVAAAYGFMAIPHIVADTLVLAAASMFHKIRLQ